jgi:hypothetical protein
VRLPEFLDSRHMEVGKVVSPMHLLPLLPGTFMVLVSVRGRVEPRVVVQSKGAGIKCRLLSIQ